MSPAQLSAPIAAGPVRVRRWSDPHQWRLWLSGLFGARYDGLRHFSVVSPGLLMRCGQPHPRDLDRIRDEHGLNTIVCARGGTRHPLRGRWFRAERRWCESHGVLFVHMPFSDQSAAPQGVFERFLHIVQDPAAHPVLVHCEQGFHRTGVLCAAYRVAAEGWPIEQALEEMDRLGFESRRAKRQTLRDTWVGWAQTHRK